MSRPAWGAWDRMDRGRRGSEHVLDSVTDDVHSALVPPGALHNRVTAALANWRLDDAETLLAGLQRDPSPSVAAAPRADGSEEGPGSLGQAWADTLRAELLVRRLRVAGFTLVGEPVSHDPGAEPALALHAGVAELIEGGPGKDADPRAESASRAALAVALVRAAQAAFDGSAARPQRAPRPPGRRPPARRGPGPARPHRAALPPDRRGHGRGGRGGQPARPRPRPERPARRHPHHAGRRPRRPPAHPLGAGLPAPRPRGGDRGRRGPRRPDPGGGRPRRPRRHRRDPAR